MPFMDDTILPLLSPRTQATMRRLNEERRLVGSCPRPGACITLHGELGLVLASLQDQVHVLINGRALIVDDFISRFRGIAASLYFKKEACIDDDA